MARSKRNTLTKSNNYRARLAPTLAEMHREHWKLSQQLSGMVYFDFSVPGNLRKACGVTPSEGSDVLRSAKIPCVVVGAHGIAGWMDQPRATIDVDIVVPKRWHRSAVRRLHESFSDLVVF